MKSPEFNDGCGALDESGLEDIGVEETVAAHPALTPEMEKKIDLMLKRYFDSLVEDFESSHDLEAMVRAW